MFIERSKEVLVKARMNEPRRLIQLLAGPRQVGKTTLIRHVMDASPMPSHYASADEPAPPGPAWINQHWQRARGLVSGRKKALLVLDEVQKVTGWSETVKALWDEDTRSKLPLQVVLLGSSPLLIQRGMSESLAGRFERIRLGHWSFQEMNAAFGWDVEQYIFYGGYPGSAPYINSTRRWASYVLQSLVETTITRDVLLMARVDKPALLRRLFDLASAYSGQELSYNKMLGQLEDAGNTSTLAGYAELLEHAGMLMGLQKFSLAEVRTRSTTPKWQVLNNALMTARMGMSVNQAKKDGERWGRIVESAVGAHLADGHAEGRYELFYWRERDKEVDFVVRCNGKLTAIEVKSGRPRPARRGMDAFLQAHPGARLLLVGAGGISLEEFLSRVPEGWLAK
jgi:hypothetical protein